MQVPFGLMLHVGEADVNHQHKNSTYYEEIPPAGTKSFVKNHSHPSAYPD